MKAWCLLLGLWMLAAEGWAAERVALVIGNTDYGRLGDLPNAENDARAVASQLQRLGFRLVGGQAQVNVGREALSDLLIRLQTDLRAGDVALFFYAGHGIAHQGRNYLVPVNDGGLQYREQLPHLAFDAEEVMKALRARGHGANLVVLDACRDNPLPSMDSDRTGSVDRGLVPMLAGADGEDLQFVYSAGPGKRAPDGGAAGNSPFTRAFVAALAQPGLALEEVLRRTAGSVRGFDPSAPLPWWEGRMVNALVLHPGNPSAAPPAVYTPDQETVVWQFTESVATEAAYRAYLAQYPGGQFAAQARMRLTPARSAQGQAHTATLSAAGDTHVREGRFNVIGDGVKDNQQGVVWTQFDDGGGRDWHDAVSYCRSLGQGWSLPTTQQLFSLYDRRAEPKIISQS